MRELPGHSLGAAKLVVDAVAVGVIAVDHRNAFWREVLCEETSLALKVIFQVLVVVEMIPREVGERSCLEHQSEDSVLRERVRRHLHHHGICSKLDHFVEGSMKLERIWSGVGGLSGLACELG